MLTRLQSNINDDPRAVLHFPSFARMYIYMYLSTYLPRFMAVHVDTNEEQGGAEKELESGSSSSTIETYKPTLPPEMWAEIDGGSFVVRGPNYATSKLKVRKERRKGRGRLSVVDSVGRQ